MTTSEHQHPAREAATPLAGRPHDTMRAIVQTAYGGPERLRADRVAVPDVDGDTVLVRVHAAGLDRGTWHVMHGTPLIVRLAFGLRRPRDPVPGLDLAGTVVAVGPDVHRFVVGDEVFGVGRGSFAEFSAAHADRLAHKPPSLTFPQAAVVGVSGVTALEALRHAGDVGQGTRVLVTGASGGVGTFAVQLAAAAGARVTAVASTAKLDLVRSLGAESVVDYTREDFAAGPDRYDVIIDIAGSPTLSRLRRALAPTGTAVIVGGEEGGRWTGGIDRTLRALALSPFVRQRLTAFIASERSADLEELAAMITAGTVTPAVHRTYRLDEVADAMRDLAAGRVAGKIAITLDG